ncbi:MAG: DNA ligase (ATP) [Claussenomyces sp. TS43310]|nr:MAG: DNA ligase (ATP) [Claussenomyces sp. TS43310]
MADVGAADEDERQYGHGPLSQEELDQKFPNRPRNRSQTLPFHQLFTTLFNPLNENKKRPPGPAVARSKRGPQGPFRAPPHEVRRNIIERFICRWRKEVGDDFYPALRLILPEKDRDRPMYGLKEKAIGKLLVKLMKIDKNSEDGCSLLNWKLPGQTTASRMAGDFAGRCFEVLSKRPMRTSVGDMRVAEVNELLDRLSTVQKEEHQLPIFDMFYTRMNAEELMWLIRIILRQMNVGASEKTFLNLWHPDGEALFNVSSSLRRVCWELTDPLMRLEDDEAGITLMQCFQPQLAQFQMHSFQRMVDSMRPTVDDTEYWIEEKLDGERMQMHMMDDENTPGGKRFRFWSRKAKDYTYLYGAGFEDESAALTRHIQEAFDPGVRNLILDGEMITWDPEADIMVPFGTLKTAALSEQRNPFQSTGHRPVFRVFDILYLNDESLVKYTLRDRHKALERCIINVHRRMEILQYEPAHDVAAIEPLLRKVVAEASEGLVLKNPRSTYRLNSRNDDWMKVKPEYMTEFGESLDCIIIGGYYGSGHRGGRLSSFLCGLKVDENHIKQGADPQKCFSFFKVGGGFRADDYANIRHVTEGKWIDWDPKRPPTEYVELGGGTALQYERPDVWIKPENSVVVSVKAASLGPSDQFRMGYTLRFPRFKRLRSDRDWKSALSIQGFTDLKARVEEESREKEFKVDTRRRVVKKVKKDMIIAGGEQVLSNPYAGPRTQLFCGLNFCILSEAVQPVKKSKAEIEQLVKGNGGAIYQSPMAAADMICIADKRVVKVASLVKAGTTSVVRCKWVLDTVTQADTDSNRGLHEEQLLIPFEPSHMFHVLPADEKIVQQATDEFGDSYARDVSLAELEGLIEHMPRSGRDADGVVFAEQLHSHGQDLNDLKCRMFHKLVVYPDPSMDKVEAALVGNLIRFAGGVVSSDLDSQAITHLLVNADSSRLAELRKAISTRKRLPRIVLTSWAWDSWGEATLLDEERYAPVG